MFLKISFLITGKVFERETHREKILEGRRREFKLKLKQSAATSAAVVGGGSVYSVKHYFIICVYNICVHVLAFPGKRQKKKTRILLVRLRKTSGTYWLKSRRTYKPKRSRDRRPSCQKIHHHQSLRKERKEKRKRLQL